MRKIKYMRIVLILLFISLKSFGQWTLVPSPSTVNLNSLHFGNENTGYIAGNGVILKTTNKCDNWIIQGTGYNYTKVHCSSIDTAYICRTTGGSGLRTINGGSNWTFVPNLLIGDLNSVFSMNSKFIYFTGIGTAQSGGAHPYTFGTGARSKDAGTTWQYFANYSWPKFNCTQFIDTLIGYAVGSEIVSNKGSILKTVDGGQNWIPLSSTYGYFWNSLCFVNTKVGYICGKNGIIRKTVDGGLNWFSQHLTPQQNFRTSHFKYDEEIGTNKIIEFATDLTSIYFTNADTGCVVGTNGMIFGTVDGGISWHKQNSGTINKLNSVYFTNSRDGYIVGDGGVILKTSNGPVEIGKIKIPNNLQIYPIPTDKDLIIKQYEENVELRIFDLVGNLITETPLLIGSNSIDLSELSNGVYIVEIRNEKTIIRKRIIKNKK